MQSFSGMRSTSRCIDKASTWQGEGHKIMSSVLVMQFFISISKAAKVYYIIIRSVKVTLVMYPFCPTMSIRACEYKFLLCSALVTCIKCTIGSKWQRFSVFCQIPATYLSVKILLLSLPACKYVYCYWQYLLVKIMLLISFFCMKSIA